MKINLRKPLRRSLLNILSTVLVFLSIISAFPILALEPPPSIDLTSLFTYSSAFSKIEKNMGALSESIALEIPPGRNGLAPDISVNYNSQDLNDGYIGYGWSLSTPFIERINKTGSEWLYADNYFTSSIGGELATTTTANEYRHRTEDGSFIKYTFSNNIWTVYDKSGTRYLFGTTTAARQAATSSPSNVYRWMLEEVRDANDNYIEYEYTSDENQIYPSRITYTGSGSADGVMAIDFMYETRPDTAISYKSVFKVQTKKRLTQIQASVNGSWVRKYVFSYTAGTNGKRSLLSNIQLTGRDENGTEVTLPAHSFGYASSTPSYSTNNSLPQLYNGARLGADVDGNGLPDMSMFRESSGNTIRSIDKNTYPTLSHSDTTIATEYWAVPTGTSYGDGHVPTERGVRFFDANGDWKTDIVKSIKYNDSSYSRVYHENQYSGGYSWASTTIATGTIPAFALEISQNEKYSSGVLGNVNGDGLVDYVISIDSSVGGGKNGDKSNLDGVRVS